MKFWIPMLLCVSALAQTHPKTKSEAVPADAVIARYNDHTPFCPRNDYEVKWFVERHNELEFLDKLDQYGLPVTKKISRLEFDPYCVPVKVIRYNTGSWALQVPVKK